MKKQAFVIFLSIGLAYSSMAQELKEEPIAVSWFTLSVAEDLYLTMELEAKTMMAIMFQHKNEEAEDLMFSSFNLIKDRINDSTTYELLPVDALQGKITYSRIGFPLASLKKASKKSDYAQFVKIDILVSAEKRSSSEGSTISTAVVGLEVSDNNYNAKFYPQVDVVLKFANESGKTIETIRGRYRHTEKVAVSSQDLKVAGWHIPLHRSAEVIPYYFFLEKAVQDLISQLKS